MIRLLIFVFLTIVASAAKADGWEPAMENTWESEMRIIDEDSFRLSTRKRVAGDVEEINKPGTSVYKAFESIQQATLLRAALESANRGVDLFRIASTRDITRQRARNRVSGDVSEDDFVMAPGHYRSEIELGIQVTVDLLEGSQADTRAGDVYSANELLIAFGLAEYVTSTPVDDS